MLKMKTIYTGLNAKNVAAWISSSATSRKGLLSELKNLLK